MSARNDSVCTAFLLWLGKHNDESPNPEQFTEDPASVVGGQQVDDRELRRAVDTLDARKLIDGARTYQDPMLARVYLTSAGTLAVNEHDGDLPAWRNATGPASMSVTAGGHVQATMNSSDVTQIMHNVESKTGDVDVAKYRRAARTLLDEVDDFDVPPVEREQLREAGEQLRDELAAPEPDQARARKIGARIVQILGALTVSSAGHYIVQLLAGRA